MDTKALQLESRFSLPPNSLGYCGQNTAAAKFKLCITEGICSGVEEEVTRFIVLHPYLKLLAEISDQPMLSYPVIESYWIGNDLLKKAESAHYDLLLEYFLKQGVPDFFVEELRLKKPERFIPNHLFQVLHIGVGRASGAVPFNIQTINNCMIRWGKVEKITSCHSRETKNDKKTKFKCASVNLSSLQKIHESYHLTKLQETVPFNPELVPELKSGDTVAVHWNMIIKILTKEEEKNLIYWTKEVLSAQS